MKEQTFNEIIQEKNEARQQAYKAQAHNLISEIIKNQEVIVGAQRKIIEAKKQLNKLQEPEEIKVEL